MSNFKSFNESNQKSNQMSSQKSTFNMSSQKSSEFSGPVRHRNFGGSGSSGFGKKETSRTATDDGWTSVPGKSTHPRYNNGGYKGSKPDASYGKDDKSQKTKFFFATKKIDDIMSTSNGNIDDIESRCIHAFNSVTTKEEKAKIIETIVSYSLHEFLDKDKFFGKIISSDMSVNASFGSIKERDGYDVFTWAIWVRYGDKRSISNLSRDNSDVIKTVEKLINLKVTPYHTNSKSESIIHTLESCVKNGKITSETSDKIYSIILESIDDAEFIYTCIRSQLHDILRDGVHFNKTLIKWGLQNPAVFDKIISSAFSNDIDKVGLASVSRADGSIEYFTLFDKLVELINSDENHKDFGKYFASKSVDKTTLISKMAETYMDKIFETYPTIYEYNVSDGYGTSKEGLCFKYLESLGAFIWDISQFLDFDESLLSDLEDKVKIGYGIKGLKKNKSNIKLLQEVYPKVHIVSQILIENTFKSVGIPFGKETLVTQKKVEEEKVDYFKNFKTGLEKIGSKTITFTSEISDSSVDDAVYDMSKIKDKVDPIDFARAFAYQACVELFSDNQINHIEPLLNYLDNNNIIKKSSFKKVIEDEEDEIIENTDCDNPKACKVMEAIKRTCA